MNWQLDPLLHLVASGFIIVVLARAVLEKVQGYALFVANLRDYRLLPEALAPLAAPLLLAAEIAAIGCLMYPAASQIGAILASLLLCLYAFAMAAVLIAGRSEIECGCGGEGQFVSWTLVARNAVLVAVSAAIMLQTSPRPMGWSDMLIGPMAVFVLLLLLATAEKTIGTWAVIRRLDSGSFN
ncbi:MauE/DoxX family redox-associated membrane protein [Bradyrhizobium sp. HKCCYLRH3099]|uniref:MauE/DoxX family redox-associated membrane protein n=1 Tax=unclassified Bradyrhizobium TaxID=2631580 RepID=UPI003EBA19DA